MFYSLARSYYRRRGLHAGVDVLDRDLVDSSFSCQRYFPYATIHVDIAYAQSFEINTLCVACMPSFFFCEGCFEDANRNKQTGHVSEPFILTSNLMNASVAVCLSSDQMSTCLAS